MKKILFLINSLEGGGAERVLVDLANELCKYDFDVTLLAVSGGGVFEKRLDKNVHYKRIVRTRVSALRKILIYALSFILPPQLVHRLFIGSKYDFEVAFLEGVPTKIISASPNSNSQKYAWVHIDLYNTFGLDKVYKNMQSHIESYKRFDKIICVSKTVKEAFIKRFGITDKLDVCYNIIDDEVIRNNAKELISKNDKFRIVSVGRLEKRKGFDRLLKVMKKLSDESINCELLIVGEGSVRDELTAYIKNNNLSHIVTLVGFSDNPYKYMQSADLCVFPSRAEGYSTVVTEAVILGKPIVVSNCSGMKEILGDSEFGIIAKDDDELYDAIKRMICDKSLLCKYSEKSAERAKFFSKKLRLKEILNLF